MRLLAKVVKANRSWENAFALLLLTLAALASFFGALLTLKWAGLLSSEVANWVQAIGSLVALFIAVWLSNNSYGRAQKDRHRDLLYKEIKAANRVLAGIDTVLERTRALENALETNNSRAVQERLDALVVCREMLKEAMDELSACWVQGHLVLQEISATADKTLELLRDRNRAVKERPLIDRLKTSETEGRLLYSLRRLQTHADKVNRACRSFIANPNLGSMDGRNESQE